MLRLIVFISHSPFFLFSFAVMAGIIAGVIRIFGGYPEGVSYSILLMNLAVPLIDKFMKPVRFGGGKA